LDKDGESKNSKLEYFGQILMRLLGCLSHKARIPDFLFCDLNEVPMKDEIFDDLLMLRRDLGSLTRNLTKCCGVKPVIKYVSSAMSENY